MERPNDEALFSEGMLVIRNLLEGQMLTRTQPGPDAALLVAEAYHNLRDDDCSLAIVAARLRELQEKYPDAPSWMPKAYLWLQDQPEPFHLA